jgi:hypothetical protein
LANGNGNVKVEAQRLNGGLTLTVDGALSYRKTAFLGRQLMTLPGEKTGFSIDKMA